MSRDALIFKTADKNRFKATLLRLCIGVIVGFLSFAVSAQAGKIALPNQGRPLATPSFNVALLFHGLTGQLPDFAKWAEATQEYKTASPYDLDQVRSEQSKKMESAYRLLSLEEPIIINTRVKLSVYSKVLQGFTIESFKPDTFFAYNFQGVDYAVVPNALMDYIYVTDVTDPDQAERIKAEMSRTDGYVPLTLYVTPRYADKSSQMQLGDKKYWLISGDISAIALYTRGKNAQILWEKGATPQGEKTKSELLDLYK